MRITILPLVFIFSALIFLGSCGSVFAYENYIGQSQIHPAHPFYFLKTIRESLELKSAGTPHIKTVRYLEFAQRRLREIKSLVKVHHEELIEPNLERYWAHLKDLNGQININQDNQMIEQVAKHLAILEKVYNQVTNLRAKMAIRLAMSRVVGFNTGVMNKLILNPNQTELVRKLTLHQLKACNFFTKEASSSSLNEVEKVVLLERAQDCFHSVRSGFN